MGRQRWERPSAPRYATSSLRERPDRPTSSDAIFSELLPSQLEPRQNERITPEAGERKQRLSPACALIALYCFFPDKDASQRPICARWHVDRALN